MVAIIRTQKGSRIVLTAALNVLVVFTVYCSARITREDGGMSPTAVVCPPYCLCSWHPQGGQYFVPGTAGAHVMPTSSSTCTSCVTHVMLTNQIDSILIITLVLIKVMHIRRISMAKYSYPFKQGNYYIYPIRIRENCGYPQNIYPRIHIRASLLKTSTNGLQLHQ